MNRVVLYGKSLLMSTIGASLEGCRDLEIITIDPSIPDAQSQVEEIFPYALIFDLAVMKSDFAIGLWREHPELLLIGVDLAMDKVLVLSSQPAHLMTTNDLVQLIRRNEPGSKNIVSIQ